ncbi:MAG: hypothetical protein ACLPY2_08320 [Bryobacteraceae bacterium]
MTFDRTWDYELVRTILTHPTLYRHMGDDFAPDPERFEVNRHPAIWYVLATEEWRAIGLFCFFPENDICWAAHVAMLRKTPPALTRQAGREVMRWLWERTPCRRLVASVPMCNRAAVRYGLDPQGMNLLPYGVNEKSFLKDGKLWDQQLMGRSRPSAASAA